MLDITGDTSSALGTNSFVVNSLSDVVNSHDGLTTLREAVIAANALSGSNTIKFDLTAGSTINLTQQLDILDDLVIKGLGAQNLTISGASAFNSLFIEDANVAIEGLTFADGRDSISVGSGVNLTVKDSLFRNNEQDGIDISGNGSSVTVRNSSFINNSDDGIDLNGTDNTLNIFGSSIFNNGNNGLEIDASDSTVTVSASNFTGNSGDGISFDDGGNNLLTIVNADITGNTGDGLDINSDRNTVILKKVDLSGNGVGTPIEVEDGLEIDGSNNTITITDAIINNNPGDGIDFNGDKNKVTASNLTISGNGEDGIEISEGSDDNV
nr:right-handed parallel beta-helix repeat-containing protein [Nostoc sp. ChiSLP01]